MSLGHDIEQRLDGMLAEYRAATPDTDGGPEFLPGLWRRIEARRSSVFQWSMMSRRVLAGAFALCLLFGLVMNSAVTGSLFYNATYVEALDDDDEPEDLALLRPASYSEEANRQ